MTCGRSSPGVVVNVPDAPIPVATAAGRYLRRAIGGDGRPTCIPYFVHEGPGGGAGTDPSATLVVGATLDDLDVLEIERFRRFVRESGGRGDEQLAALSDVDLLEALGAIEANGDVRAVRRVGLLLFGKEPSLGRLLPAHEASWQVIERESVLANDFYRWPLLRLFEEIGGRFRARNRSVELVDLFRTEIPDFSEEGFREALANALIHRDYDRLGAVHVQWTDTGIRIDNRGGFPDGVRLDNRLVTAPRPRNPLLADAFKRAGVVERTGRGVEFLVTEGRAGRSFSVWELLVLGEVRERGTVSLPELAPVLQGDEANVRSVVTRMVEAGMLEGRGERRARTYHLSSGLYRKLGDPGGYVRTRGFDRIQQEQMVLQYVTAHGSITRSQAAELCRITPRQATGLLTKLVSKNRLRLSGRGKGAHYLTP